MNDDETGRFDRNKPSPFDPNETGHFDPNPPSGAGRRRGGRPAGASMSTKTALVVAAAAALIGFLLVAYFFSGRGNDDNARATQDGAAQQTTDARSQNADARAGRTQQGAQGGGGFFEELFAPDAASSSTPAPQESWTVTVPRVLVRLVLAALLAAGLAYRPRRHFRVIQRNPYVAQTQILLAVVASALMMIVGDSAARAFGIFAAASLVRFRTNISDPKEITVLLVSLGIGLATGVGHWEIALVLALFVLPLLWVLEYYEPAQAFRAMELKVKTHDVARTQRILKRIFRKYRFMSEIRQLDPADAEEPIGELSYLVNVSLDVSTDQLSREIFAADSNNIESIEWEPSKSGSYIYK
ncbi:MAG TPA: DUF4956 domain-containing protein [Pyrinomonadaceae bacterium]|nr:DUF4956 domain-containing protein [Pyrinomonadaceae bacterium]